MPWTQSHKLRNFFIDFESCRKQAMSLEHLSAVLFFNAAGGNIVWSYSRLLSQLLCETMARVTGSRVTGSEMTVFLLALCLSSIWAEQTAGTAHKTGRFISGTTWCCFQITPHKSTILCTCTGHRGSWEGDGGSVAIQLFLQPPDEFILRVQLQFQLID